MPGLVNASNPTTIATSGNGRAYTGALTAVGHKFTGINPFATSDSAGTGDFALLALANPVAHTARSIPFGAMNGATLPVAYLSFNGTDTDTNSSGRLAFYVNDGAHRGVNTNSTSVINGNWHMFAVVRRRAVYEIYVDGLSYAVTTATGGGTASIYNRNCNLHVGGYESTGYGLNGRSLAFAAAYARAPSAEEIALLSRNPWQLFAPKRIWVPITAAGSSLPTLSIPTYVPGSLTTTGFRPRVSFSF